MHSCCKNRLVVVLTAVVAGLSFVPFSNAAVIEETGSLIEFIAGNEQGCAYDNWISHTSEADQVNNPSNFAPPELDRETNGFGAYQVVDSLPNPNSVLADWSAIFRYLIQGDAASADARLAGSWMTDYYDVVRLDDNGTIYLMLREVLNNGYFDNNSTPNDQTDDVTGSFDLGWGLFVVRLGATNPQVVIEVVHPSTDFASPYIALDAFNTIDAGCLFINGASRNIAWSGPTYSESVSLSDPSRNARTPYQEAHKAAVDLLQDEWVLQLHGFNPFPAHPGVPSAQVSAERENKVHTNPPIMSEDHFDMQSLIPNPPVSTHQQLWPYPEPSITDYYAVYYPGLNNVGRYNWRGEIPIPNNVDLPGTIDNCQMVYTHAGHNFINDDENWTHIEMDEWPDVVRLDGVSQLQFLKYNGPGTGVPTYDNYEFMIHYYHPIFVAAAQYLEGPPAPVQAVVIEESAPLVEFYQGSTQNCEYDNWVSHVSEGVALAGYNDYGPAELDRQTSGFGRFQLVPNGTPGDGLLGGWRDVFDAFIAGDAYGTAAALTAARLGGIYQVVHLTDGGDEYLILREELNNNFFDNNGTAGVAGDDVTGSFSYGWGLYVKKLGASRPQVVLEAPHPCDDYIAPAMTIDAFQTLDAGMMFVAGAGREVVWSDTGSFTNSKSRSDPTRNSRHPFEIAHEAAVDAIESELVIQVHSFDTDAHLTSKSLELSAYNDPTPNPPLMDRTDYHDLISNTPEYPITANSIGGANHSAVRVNDYYSVYYPSGSYSWRNQIAMTTTVSQWGYSQNPQMLYSHIGHNQMTDAENWLHFEADEFPNAITENVLSFYDAGGVVPTHQNFSNITAYYHPLSEALVRTLNAAPVWTSVPAQVSAAEADIIQFDVVGADADGDALTITYSGDLPISAQFTDNGNGSGSLYWQTDYASSGDYTANFQLSDGSSSVDVIVIISIDNVNRVPVLAGIGNQSVGEGGVLAFSLSATDPDGDALTYSGSNLPTGAVLTGADFSWTPDYDQAGNYPMTFEVSDGGLTDSETITITVNNVNQSPILTEIGAKSINEDAALGITLSAGDPDGDALTYSATNLPLGATFIGAVFSWTPEYDQAGDFNVTFQVTDGMATDQETITITVINVNRPPVLAGIGAQSVNEGSDLIIALSAGDPDGDAVTYSALNLPAGATLLGPEFSWTPDYLQAGTFDVIFRASDGSLRDEETITITVNNINASPVLGSIGNQSANEGEVLAFTLSATDVDNDELTYSAIDLPEGATLTGTDFSWSPGFTEAGIYSLTFGVSDGLLGDSEAITITINNVNRAPVLAGVGSQSVNEDVALNFVLSATDPDGDALTYSASELPAGATLTGADFSWTPNFAQAGAYTLTFSANDGLLSDDEQITITVNNVNRSPELAGIGNQSVDEGATLNLTLSASDPDGDALTYSASELPAGASLTGADFSWTPNFAQAGTYNVTFSVTDGSLNDSEALTITVNNINGPPVLAGFGNQSVNEGAALHLTLSATDMDGDAITYSATSIPAGATLNGADFDWTPNYTQSGDYTVTFIASDGFLTDEESVSITVINVNLPPVLAGIGAQSVAEGAVLAFSLSANDPDGDAMTYSASELPAGATLTGADFSWTPSFAQAGTYNVTFGVTDGSLSDSEALTITVNNINGPPVLASIGNQSADEGAALTITLSATDVDGDQLTYSAMSLPLGATLTGADFNWTPDYTQAGEVNVTFRVTDGTALDDESITITVNNVNRAPELASVGNQSVDEAQSLNFTLSASDPDGDAVTFSASNLPAGATFTGVDFSWSPDYAQAGGYDVTFEVSDGSLSDTETITITVNNVNRPPTLASIGNQSVDEGGALNFTLSANDPDGDAMEFSASNLPSGSYLNGVEFSWSPDFVQAGDYSVTFDVTDGSLSDGETIVITVNNVNRPPVWTDVPGSVTGQAGDLIGFTITGSDPDGDTPTVTYLGGLPEAVQFTDGGNGSGELVWQTDQYSGGDYSAEFRLSDGVNSVDTSVPVSVTGGVSIAYAVSEQNVAGTVQGSFNNTFASDNNYERLTERLSGGSVNNQYSYLEQKWTIPAVGNNMLLHVEAFHTANGEGDDFILAGSFDGTTYTNLVTVTKTADDNAEQVVAIAGQSIGNYYVRLRDANRTGGRRVLDSFSLDRLYITYNQLDPVMIVSDIAMTRQTSSRNVLARGVVTILSTGGTPMAGAVVSATWSGLTNQNVQATTNASGQVTFNSASLRNPTGDFILTVTNVTKNNWTYDANQNVETSDLLHVVNGQLASFDEVVINFDPAIPVELTLTPAYPNPFNNATFFRIGIPREMAVDLAVYDIRGRRVEHLAMGTLRAGWYSFAGVLAEAPNGEYFIRLSTGTTSKVTRVQLIR